MNKRIGDSHYMKGIFIDIYRGQKIYQQYVFRSLWGCSENDPEQNGALTMPYDEFRKEGCYFVWTEFHSVNPAEPNSKKYIPIIDITETGYHSNPLPSINLDLPERVEDMHKYMISQLTVKNIENMKDRMMSYSLWHKNHDKEQVTGQKDLLLF